MHLWKVHMIDEVKEKHSNRIMYQVFEEIRRDRDGERADMSAVAKVVQSLSMLPLLYHDDSKKKKTHEN